MNVFEKPVALEPKAGGGKCIGDNALEPADIIISTTRAAISGFIRVGTWSTVSHAGLYVGRSELVEAIRVGVVRRSLDVALADDALAVAYRSPAMTPDTAKLITQYAISQLGKPYAVRGALLATDKVLCRLLGSRPATFFCSQLVLESYRRGGLPLSDSPSECITPKDAVLIAQNQLVYAGHLLGDPSWFPVVSP